MKKYLTMAVAAFAAFFALASCSSDDDAPAGPVSKHIAGSIEKGPFVQGSEVALTDLGADLSQTGRAFTTNTQNDLGNFDFGQELNLSSGIVELKTSGYFYNECSGSLSNSQITLKAIANANETKNLNVNLLTHLEYARVRHLVKGGASFAKAKEQTEEEILKTFAITQRMSSPEKVSLTDNSKDAGILLAISSIMLYGKTEAEFSEFIAKFSSDLEKDGSIDDPSLIEKIKEGQKNCQPKSIIERMEQFYNSKGCNIKINDFSPYVDFNGDGMIDDKDDEFLDITPTDSMITESFWHVEEELKLSLSSVHRYAQDYISMQTKLDAIRLSGDGLGNINPASSLVAEAWQSGYACCRNALVIEKAIEGSKLTFDATPYLAQAKAIRAFIIYNMAMQWGNIPILDQIPTSADYRPFPSSQEKQFWFALKLIDQLDFGTQPKDMCFSKADACTLKAELYLALGMSREATMALESVSSHSGEKNVMEAYLGGYVECLAEEAAGKDNSKRWFGERISRYGTFAALKRLGMVQSLTGIDAHYNLLPIPSGECAINTALSQNYGY